MWIDWWRDCSRPGRCFAVTTEEDLYRDTLLEHSRSPHNCRTLESPTHQHAGLNPLCGDEVELQLKIDGDRVVEAGFQGSGCLISQASASMLMQLLEGRTLAEVRDLIGLFKGWMKDRKDQECPEILGDFLAMTGVKNYPVRIKCALLSWTTLEQALKAPL